MSFRGPASFLVLLPLLTWAQFPLTRGIEVRTGQRPMAITTVVEDAHGLLWVGGEQGLYRTDGEFVEAMVRTDRDPVVALARAHEGVCAAFGSGLVLRCGRIDCDTLLLDTLLHERPVRGLAVDREGRLWLGTYGAGVWYVSGAGTEPIQVANGMPDDHVNGMAALPDGSVVAATDQGLVLLREGRVMEVLGERRGAPDNLVLCVAVDLDGAVWAGTDRGGLFRWSPLWDGSVFRPEQAEVGAITAIAAHGGLVWAGAQQEGLLLFDMAVKGSLYRGASATGDREVASLFVTEDGSAWWCDRTEHVRRSDPSILVVPEDEGKELRRVSALCMGPEDRLWFADPDGLFSHAAGFARPGLVRKEPVDLPAHKPIVSLAMDAEGTVWSASFGGGVHAIGRGGRVRHFTTGQGLPNDNVLAVRVGHGSIWCATLDGLGVLRPGTDRWASVPVPGPGFVYDVLPMPDGGVVAATDGNGLLSVAADGTVTSAQGDVPSTFYALVRGDGDVVWAVGPGTGLCKLEGGVLTRIGPGGMDLFGEPFALAMSHGQVIVFGKAGTAAYDPLKGSWSGLGARMGLEAGQGPLNGASTLADGTIWCATEHGLLRLRPRAEHLRAHLRPVVLEIALTGTRLGPSATLRTSHDRNDLTVRFAAPVRGDPTTVRFAYRLIGHDAVERVTRDREVSYADLPPGDYTFSIRAFVGAMPSDAGSDAETVSFTLSVARPWWKLPWVIALGTALAIALVLLVVRARDRRARLRERIEQDRVRFQLEALRSQVDPHFLFNSFNTLVELIDSDPEGAVLHVDELSTFYRSILQLRDRDLIPLADELDLLQRYFGLEKRRFGDRIALNVELPGPPEGRIVPLTLQLLVENALKHNAITGAVFTVTIRVEAVEVVVSNPIQPRVSAARSTGFGLDSIRKRYAALTPRPVRVEREGGLFSVRIPLVGTKS